MCPRLLFLRKENLIAYNGRIKRSFAPREQSEQRWAKFGRATARSEPLNSCYMPRAKRECNEVATAKFFCP